jgi:hypothetical protein
VAPGYAGLGGGRGPPGPTWARGIADDAYSGVVLALVDGSTCDRGGNTAREKARDVVGAIKVGGGAQKGPFVAFGRPPAAVARLVGEKADDVGLLVPEVVLVGPPNGCVHVPGVLV